MPSNEFNPSVSQLASPWTQNENSVWLATSLCLHRNIEKFKFPGKMAADRRQQVVAFASKELMTVDGLEQATLLKAEEISPLDKEYLMEHFLSTQSFKHAHIGEGFLIDPRGVFLATFNLQNHLQLYLIETSDDIEKAWNQLTKIETAVGQNLGYAFSPKFGFLTADPNQCGTAFTAAAYLQLSALVQVGELDTTIKKLQEDQLIVTGIQGSPTEIIGDILVVHNRFTLGITEENIISSIRSAAAKVQALEEAARQRLKEKEKADVKDHVARAFGNLLHAYQIETIEALNDISLMKLGVDLGWITGTTISALNHLFFSCRRAHLLGKLNMTVTPEEIPHQRAGHIHQLLKNVVLTI